MDTLNNLKQNPEILIVDDISENIQVIASILQRKNYEISIATNGKQAIEAAIQAPPDLILLDISMPDMNGIEVCKKLQEDSITKHIPIIFLTALSEKENIIEGLNAGAVDYITKPFNAAELTKRVDNHIRLKLSQDYIIKKNQELQELNNTKDKFFSIIAHDLKNPFNSLFGFTNLLLSQYHKISEEKKIEYIEIINDAAKYGNQLLENLLYWSQSQLKQVKLQPEIINLNSIIQNVISTIEIQAISKNITIKSESISDSSAFADQNTIELVIRNLISNAIKFTNEGGHIEIKISDEKESLIITVSDSGIGIKPDKLFTIFKNEVLSTKGTKNEKGSGLGLIICKEYIEKNKGNIWVESELGKGSTFKFSLPKSSLND